RNCPQYLAELLKKKKNAASGAGGSGIFVIELNTILNRSWIYNTGCGTHICNTTQGLRASRKLKPEALSLYVGNGQREAVEVIGAFHLCLPSGLEIVLNNCHYALFITKGVISVSCLYEDGFINRFVNNTIQVSINNMVYFSAIPRDGIFEIDLSNSYTNDSSIYAVSNKRAKLDLDYALLWHCRLGHISKKRIEKLQHDGLLDSYDLRDFKKCVSCMSGKMTRKPHTHQVERAKDLLRLIHTDEVENQLGKTIKSLRSDRGGDYMSQEFLDHLKDHGIIAHRTPPYTPQHNGVSDRRNRTLLDMVRSMMSQTTLPKSFWDYALETAARILNMVPTKKVEKTPYEVWHGKAPKMSTRTRDPEGPSAGSDRGSKRQKEGGEHASASTPSETATGSAGISTTGSQSRQLSASKSAFAKEPVQTTCQMEEPPHLVFETGADDQPIVQTSQHPEWFSQPRRPPSPDRPTYELMRGSCTSLTELEYHLEEVYKATTDQLDWVNPEGQQYPHNLLQPLPLIPDNQGRRVIPFDHFINNDLEYLRGGASSRKYTTSVTKTKATYYGHIKWIEDLVPRAMWIQEPINYDRHALWGVSHWGRKRDSNAVFADQNLEKRGQGQSSGNDLSN
nr:hypothetical protein [Tanacetum cinerariifolium]